MNRDEQTSLPTRFISCPLGARKTSNSCEKYHCEYVSIPIRQRTFSIRSTTVEKFVIFLLILFFVKILFSFVVFLK